MTSVPFGFSLRIPSFSTAIFQARYNATRLLGPWLTFYRRHNPVTPVYMIAQREFVVKFIGGELPLEIAFGQRSLEPRFP